MRKLVKRLSHDGVLLGAVPFALIAAAWFVAKLTVDYFLYHNAGCGYAQQRPGKVPGRDLSDTGHRFIHRSIWAHGADVVQAAAS
jgi:hypothetical protein